MAAESKPTTPGANKRKSPRKFSKVIIALVLISTAIFTVAMAVIYCVTGGIPDTLVTCFFAFAGGEAGVLGLIKHSETKYAAKDRSANSETDDGSEAVG